MKWKPKQLIMEKREVMSSQEIFWSGEFGNSYIKRNDSFEWVRNNVVFFSQVFRNLNIDPKSILEIGANIGLNLEALSFLFPNAVLDAVEVNEKACKVLMEKNVNTYNVPFSKFETSKEYDLVLSKGVLIHMNPEQLTDTYLKMAKLSKKWIVIAEYFNPVPESIEYRGHKDKLFKRDFAGEFLKINDNWEIQDYGFSYRKALFPQDDLTWFLLRKKI